LFPISVLVRLLSLSIFRPLYIHRFAAVPFSIACPAGRRQYLIINKDERAGFMWPKPFSARC